MQRFRRIEVYIITSVQNEKSRCQTINDSKIRRHNIRSSRIMNEDKKKSQSKGKEEAAMRTIRAPPHLLKLESANWKSAVHQLS